MSDRDKGGIFKTMARKIKWVDFSPNAVLGSCPPTTSHPLFLRATAPLIHLTWLGPTVLRFPSITGNASKFTAFAMECAQRRKDMGSSVKDLFYHLVCRLRDFLSSFLISEFINLLLLADERRRRPT